MIKKITQSFFKSFRRYLNGELCGHIIKHCWVDDKLLPPSKAMKVGIWFEYCLSKALPKDGQIPQPEMMKSGKDMMEPYRKAKADAEYVLGLLKLMGLKIVKVGQHLDKGKYSGTVDLICQAEKDLVLKGITIPSGTMIVIDVKYSGLLDDRWNEMGWMFTDFQKLYHKTQAVQYDFISGMPFFFMVVDSSHKEKDEDDKPINPEVKFFHIPVSKRMTEEHIADGNALLEKFKTSYEFGFVPRPSLGVCNKCPLKESCPDRAVVPSIEVVDLTLSE